MEIRFEDVNRDSVLCMAVNWVKDHGPKPLPSLLKSWMRRFKVDYYHDVISKFGDRYGSAIDSQVKYFHELSKKSKAMNNSHEFKNMWAFKSQIRNDEILDHISVKMISLNLTDILKSMLELVSEQTGVAQSDILRLALYEFFDMTDQERLIDQKAYTAAKGFKPIRKKTVKKCKE